MQKATFHQECPLRDHCGKHEVCPMVLVQEIISGKWKILILWYLSYDKLRFSDLKRRLPDVTQKMLTQQLRSLEKDDLVLRIVYPEIPPRVEYSLTALGRRLIPLLGQMHSFGADLLETQGR